VKLSGPRRGFVLPPKRWVVEQAFARPPRSWRLARPYERLPEVLVFTSFIAFSFLLLRKAAPPLAIIG